MSNIVYEGIYDIKLDRDLKIYENVYQYTPEDTLNP